MIRGMILRVGGAVALATIFALAAVTGAHASAKKPAKAAKLAVSAPASVTAGEGFEVKLTAVSRQGKPVRDFNGAVTASSDVSGGTVPGRIKLVKGRASVPGFELVRAGDVNLSFNGKIKGAARIAVEAGELAELDLSAPGTATAGERFSVSAIPSDRYGNAVDADPAFSITAPGACDADGCTVPRAGSYVVSADSGSVHAERTVEVSRGTVASIEIEAPASVSAGDVFKPSAKAYDAQGRELFDQSEEIMISLSDGDCGVQGCSTTRAGTVKVRAQVDGVGAERAVNVRPGAAKNIALTFDRGTVMSEPQPNGANADYSKLDGYPTSLTAGVTVTDSWGNAVDASGVQLSGPGLSCSGLTCTGTGEGYRLLTATLGDVSASTEVRVIPASQSYSMTCRGENYDLDLLVGNGCEYAQRNPGHTTADTATNLGRFFTCADSGSSFYFDGTYARDTRRHTGVEGFDESNSYRGAPLFWKVQAGSGFCSNDVYLKLEGTSAERACVMVTVRGADGRLIDNAILSDNGSVELQTGSGAYRDNEVLTFAVTSSCSGSSYTNKTDFTVSGHL